MRLARDSQISPPQVRVPMTSPSPRRLKPSAKASPSLAVWALHDRALKLDGK